MKKKTKKQKLKALSALETIVDFAEALESHIDSMQDKMPYLIGYYGPMSRRYIQLRSAIRALQKGQFDTAAVAEDLADELEHELDKVEFKPTKRRKR